METGTQDNTRSRKILFRILVCALILGAGIVAMVGFAGMKKPPQKARHQEHPIEVEVWTARPEQVGVRLTGFGVAMPVDVVTLSSQVRGKIVATHARFKQGEVIPKGELLFKIEAVDYEVARIKAETGVMEQGAALARLETQFASDAKRIHTLTRTRDLAAAEYGRVKGLFEKSRVGNRSGVDIAEKNYNTAKDLADRLETILALYPISIKEANTRLRAARADLTKAGADLERCVITAPFTGRIKTVFAEQGEYTTPGKEILVLADDSVHELRVSLDSRETARWLRFEAPDRVTGPGWFSSPAAVQCKVAWVEDPDTVSWTGRLHRVVEFDPDSRSVTVAVRVANHFPIPSHGVSLVEGMFCSVTIPGKMLDNVYKVPRWSVTDGDTIYVVEANRLKTHSIVRAYSQGQFVFISRGITPGETIILTRLVDPMENALVKSVPHGPSNSN